MSSSEGVPLWNSVTDPVANALEFALGVTTGSRAVFSRSTIAAIESAVNAEQPSIIPWKRCPSRTAGDHYRHCGVCSCGLEGYCAGQRECYS